MAMRPAKTALVVGLSMLALSGCGGEKPLLDQPIKTLTCVEPTALPTLVPLGDGRVPLIAAAGALPLTCRVFGRLGCLVLRRLRGHP